MGLSPEKTDTCYVFLASPGDMAEERRAVREFFDRYNTGTAHHSMSARPPQLSDGATAQSDLRHLPFGKEIVVQELFDRVRAVDREYRRWEPRLLGCQFHGVWIRGARKLREWWPQVWIIVQQVMHLQPLLNDGAPPTAAPLGGLKSPFQHVPDENLQPAQQLPPVSFTHGFELVGDVLGIDLRQAPLPEKFRVVKRPNVEILFINGSRHVHALKSGKDGFSITQRLTTEDKRVKRRG